MLVITGDHDDRVVPSHSYKYVATLQYTIGNLTDQGPILAKISKDEGHSGSDSL
jgi:prolyl oligopeptidase